MTPQRNALVTHTCTISATTCILYNILGRADNKYTIHDETNVLTAHNLSVLHYYEKYTSPDTIFFRLIV